MNRLSRLPLCLIWLCVACSGPAPTRPPACLTACTTVHVINRGWHTGLVLPIAGIPEGLLPEAADFPAAEYLELGWGDRDYYQADNPGPWQTLKAACWPTASVLHGVGFRGGVQRQFAGYEIVRLDLERDRFGSLAAFVDRSFDRGGQAKADILGPGYGLNSRFYPAHGQFHLFNTCNSWVSQALEAAGYPMGAITPFTAEAMMSRIRPLARKERGQ